MIRITIRQLVLVFVSGCLTAGFVYAKRADGSTGIVDWLGWVICVVPAVMSLLLADGIGRRNGKLWIAAVLLGIGMRTATVVLAVVILAAHLRDRGIPAESLAMAATVSYLSVLTIETLLLATDWPGSYIDRSGDG